MTDFQMNAAELAALRTAQDGHMLDVGNILAFTLTTDGYGQPVEGWGAPGPDILCGLDMRPGSERHTADMTIVTYDATARIPITTVVNLKDRFQVTKMYGETLLIPFVFDIVSPPQRGPSGLRLVLKQVTT